MNKKIFETGKFITTYYTGRKWRDPDLLKDVPGHETIDHPE